MTNSANPQAQRVMCVGILVADLFIPPLAELPAAGELVVTGEFLLDSGGCAANTSTCLSKLGHRATVIGKVGADPFGDFVERDLAKKGVDTSGVGRCTQSGTSKTVIVPVTGDDRRYIHTMGANADLRREDIEPWLDTHPEIFYLGGYLVLPGLSPSDACRCLERARRGGGRTVLDVVVPEGERPMDQLLEVLPHVDIFMPNENEAQAITGMTAARDQALTFLRAGCRTVIITKGPEGALLATENTLIEVEAIPTKVVDGSGAGDAFAAGFIAGMLEGRQLEECLQLGALVGASACTALGCHEGVLTGAETFSRLRDWAPAVRPWSSSLLP